MKNDSSSCIPRRTFLQRTARLAGLSLLSPLLPACDRLSGHDPYPVQRAGASFSRGHRLREGIAFPQPVRVQRFEGVLIAGGGVSGLSAARTLNSRGVKVKVMELESDAGGNARWGSNGGGEFPLGAHYLPVPGAEMPELLAFLQDAGVITGVDENGLPEYQPGYICFEPEEQLFIHGRWQEGIIPKTGVPENELLQMKDFFSRMDDLRNRKGNDGRFAFALPLDHSSTDVEWRKLDALTFTEWLRNHQYDSPHLLWYLDYCCRDEYGTSAAETSAWAGIQYFACRKGRGKGVSHHHVLVWPEGNGFLVKHLLRSLPDDSVLKGKLVYDVSESEAGVQMKVFDFLKNESEEWIAPSAILATPRFVTHRILKGISAETGFSWAPWVVVNLYLKNQSVIPWEPAWDNVVYGSASLGFIHSGHQVQRGTLPQETNFTWYHALTGDPVERRKELLDPSGMTSESKWAEIAIAEIEKTHPGLREMIADITVTYWGHAMIRPLRGFIWGEERRKASQSVGNIHFAHADLSGISVFEEAFYQGIRAAEEIIRKKT